MSTGTVNTSGNGTQADYGSPDLWSMDVPTPGGDYTPCPAGNHPGRICGLFDIGHHPEEKTDDKTKAKTIVDTHKLVLVFELAERQANGKPHTMALKLTWSMHEKSSFFKLVTGITGVRLQPNTKFNPLTLLGTPVLVNVVQKPGKENKVHANVETVSQWMRGLPEPAWQYSPVAWSVREVGKPFPEFDWLPLVYGKSVKTLAGESTEARGFSGPRPTTTVSPGQSPHPAAGAISPPAAAPAYTHDCLMLMTKYGLQPGYTDDDLALASGRLRDGLPAADRETLEAFATPF